MTTQRILIALVAIALVLPATAQAGKGGKASDKGKITMDAVFVAPEDGYELYSDGLGWYQHGKKKGVEVTQSAQGHLYLHVSSYKRTRSFYLNLDDARCVVGDPCPTGTCCELPPGLETGPNVVHGTVAVGVGEEGYAPASVTLTSEGVPDYVRFCFGSLLKHCRALNGTRLLKEELGGRKWRLTAEKAVGCEPRHGYCWEFDFVIDWWPQ